MTTQRAILIVDDEPEIVELISDLVAPVGCRILTASNGQEALALVAAEKPHLIISDIRMPHLDGLEMLACLSEVGNRTPVVFISAYGEKDKMVRAWQLGAFDFIDKPFDDEKVLLTVRNALAQEASETSLSKLGRLSRSRFQDFHTQIPKPLYDQLRTLCTSQGTSVSTLVVELLEGYAQQAKRPVKKAA